MLRIDRIYGKSFGAKSLQYLHKPSIRQRRSNDEIGQADEAEASDRRIVGAGLEVDGISRRVAGATTRLSWSDEVEI